MYILLYKFFFFMHFFSSFYLRGKRKKRSTKKRRKTRNCFLRSYEREFKWMSLAKPNIFIFSPQPCLDLLTFNGHALRFSPLIANRSLTKCMMWVGKIIINKFCSLISYQCIKEIRRMPNSTIQSFSRKDDVVIH